MYNVNWRMACTKCLVSVSNSFLQEMGLEKLYNLL